MRLDDERPSEHVEDRRGQAGGFGFPRGGGGRIRVTRARGGMGIGGLLLLLVAAYFLGVNPLAMIFGNGGPGAPAGQREATAPSRPGGGAETRADAGKLFVARVLHTTERTWGKIFSERLRRRYEPPTLVLFRGYVRSACGMAASATGPFYCPGDRKVYIDLSFYETLKNRLGAKGDFAQAYVIAHEVGHHVQNLLGIAGKIAQARMRLPRAKANELSVRMELQADCFAGVWGRDNSALLDPGDVEEALNAAAAIGDDRLQRRSRGYVTPDSFTHGTSAQRVRWLRRGLEKGDIGACDTFAVDRP